jgi:hypothetical protein
MTEGVLTFDISRGGHYVETRRQVIIIEGMRWKSRKSRTWAIAQLYVLPIQRVLSTKTSEEIYTVV